MKQFLASALALIVTITAGAVRVHTLGDSLAEAKPTSSVQQGWPTFLQAFFDVHSNITVVNPAKSGTSAMTFYRGNWSNRAERNVQPGDYVLIGFGHNDEKLKGADSGDYNRYLLQQGQDTLTDLRGSVPTTTYRYWLTRLVEEVRAKGAHPVLYSTICRMYFRGDSITRAGRHDLGDKFNRCEQVNGTWVYTQNNHIAADDHSMDYSYQIEQLARELDVPFLNLTAASQRIFERYGAARTKAVLGIPTDGTHISMVGANLMAREVAIMLRDSVPYFADKVVIPTATTANPAAIEVGECYTAIATERQTLIQGYDMGDGGTITVTAGDEITVSLDGEHYEHTASTEWVGSTLMQRVYIRSLYPTPGRHQGKVTVTLSDGTTINIPVTATAIRVSGESRTIVSDEEQHISWTADEIDQSDERYLQFAYTAPADTQVWVTNIAYRIASKGKIRYRCRYSTDERFGENRILSENLSATTQWEDSVSASPVIRLQGGESLYIRFYPWSRDSKTNHFTLQHIQLTIQKQQIKTL